MKTRLISLSLEEILFDIKDRAHKFGKSREAEGQTPFEAASNMQGSFEDEDSDLVYRSVIASFAEIRREMADYLTCTEAGGHDNEIHPEGITGTHLTLTLTLTLPDNFNDAALADIAAQAHQFVVVRALADWFAITAPAATEQHMALAARAIDSIKRAVSKRTKPQRPQRTAAQPQQ